MSSKPTTDFIADQDQEVRQELEERLRRYMRQAQFNEEAVQATLHGPHLKTYQVCRRRGTGKVEREYRLSLRDRDVNRILYHFFKIGRADGRECMFTKAVGRNRVKAATF